MFLTNAQLWYKWDVSWILSNYLNRLPSEKLNILCQFLWYITCFPWLLISRYSSIDSLFWVLRYFIYIIKSLYLEKSSIFRHIPVLKYEFLIFLNTYTESGDTHRYQCHWNSISIICFMRNLNVRDFWNVWEFWKNVTSIFVFLFWLEAYLWMKFQGKCLKCHFMYKTYACDIFQMY